jgi:hypothetical protein
MQTELRTVRFPVAKNSARLAFVSSSILLVACGTIDHFPMRNPITGENVTCRSGEYWIEESSFDVDVATSCIHAAKIMASDSTPVIRTWITRNLILRHTT